MARRSGHSNRRGSGDDAGLILLLAVLEGLLFWWVGKGIFGAAKKGRRRLHATAESERLPAPSTPYKDTLDNRYAWRLNCEDGSAYGIRPEDYETRAAYNAALKRQKAMSESGSEASLPEVSHDVGSDNGIAGPEISSSPYLICRVSLLSNGKTETVHLEDLETKVGDIISVTVEGKEDKGVVVAIEPEQRGRSNHDPANGKTYPDPAAGKERADSRRGARFDDFSAFFDDCPAGQESADEELVSESAAGIDTAVPAEADQGSPLGVEHTHLKSKAQRQGMSRKTKKTLVFVSLAVVILGSVLAYKISVDRALERALDAYKTEVEALCDAYGIENISTEIHKLEDMDDYNIYSISIKGTGANRMSYEKLYDLIEGINNIWIDLDDTVPIAFVTLDGHDYSVYQDELSRDMEPVYTYMTEEEREDREALANMLPYEGMDAKYIDYTKLGRPDAEWDGEYFDEKTKTRRTEKFYTWLDSNKDRQAEARVRETYRGTWRITEVTIYGAAYRPGDTGVYRPAATSAPKPRTTSKPVTSEDEFDVYNYTDPEDFYYDHPDDFFDYEDAEDYFYEH